MTSLLRLVSSTTSLPNLALVLLGICALTLPLPAEAQTTAPGPYYATPSWDQTLPSNTRFIVLSNMASAAVLDRETGLVWERFPLSPLSPGGGDPGRRTWSEAQQRCRLLRAGNRLGWRLPALEELGSLADPSVTSSPALPAGHPSWVWTRRPPSTGRRRVAMPMPPRRT
jgi:hypothetical protein